MKLFSAKRGPGVRLAIRADVGPCPTRPAPLFTHCALWCTPSWHQHPFSTHRQTACQRFSHVSCSSFSPYRRAHRLRCNFSARLGPTICLFFFSRAHYRIDRNLAFWLPLRSCEFSSSIVTFCYPGDRRQCLHNPSRSVSSAIYSFKLQVEPESVGPAGLQKGPAKKNLQLLGTMSTALSRHGLSLRVLRP